MVRQEIRDDLAERGYPLSIVYDEPSFDESILGVDHSGRTVYSFELMVEEYVRDEVGDVSTLSEDEYYEKRDEAIEFIEYNTLRATPYMGTGAPVVIDYNPEDEVYYDMVRDDEFTLEDLDLEVVDNIEKFKEISE